MFEECSGSSPMVQKHQGLEIVIYVYHVYLLCKHIECKRFLYSIRSPVSPIQPFGLAGQKIFYDKTYPWVVGPPFQAKTTISSEGTGQPFS